MDQGPKYEIIYKTSRKYKRNIHALWLCKDFIGHKSHEP